MLKHYVLFFDLPYDLPYDFLHGLLHVLFTIHVSEYKSNKNFPAAYFPGNYLYFWYELGLTQSE